MWKKIRSFIRKDSDDRSHWHENGWKTMSLRDYKEYLNMREAGDEAALNEVLYWIDFPMAEFLPELSQDFKRSAPSGSSFELPLRGWPKCWMLFQD